MNKKSFFFMALVALAAVLALSACGSKTNNNASSPSASAPAGTASAPAAGGGETKEITVGAKNFEFDQTDIKVKVGDTVKLTLKNENGNHGLAVPDLNINLKNGETATFTADKPGTYAFNCSIQCGSGHDNMTGTITVE
ncbi:cupredoxin domain-containing protein [Cohnella sp. REN36]|uniref:cupredoxin domain-containing protein n=1 Tax=Cohnella sp. REN36 TaxID=2887347 RepID=UPI001D153BC2|nr:cupredoxin domain-containing protein [Cohnella sp. REN36]MCC3375877.1 cupredoxin domain-containing protein [Cohnella sp. REN36]